MRREGVYVLLYKFTMSVRQRSTCSLYVLDSLMGLPVLLSVLFFLNGRMVCGAPLLRWLTVLRAPS